MISSNMLTLTTREHEQSVSGAENGVQRAENQVSWSRAGGHGAEVEQSAGLQSSTLRV